MRTLEAEALWEVERIVMLHWKWEQRRVAVLASCEVQYMARFRW
jgi:hypothetical protein